MANEIVDIIASGYEWICPKCETLNRHCEYTEIVECVNCGKQYNTAPPEHAIG